MQLLCLPGFLTYFCSFLSHLCIFIPEIASPQQFVGLSGEVVGSSGFTSEWCCLYEEPVVSLNVVQYIFLAATWGHLEGNVSNCFTKSHVHITYNRYDLLLHLMMHVAPLTQPARLHSWCGFGSVQPSSCSPAEIQTRSQRLREKPSDITQVSYMEPGIFPFGSSSLGFPLTFQQITLLEARNQRLSLLKKVGFLPCLIPMEADQCPPAGTGCCCYSDRGGTTRALSWVWGSQWGAEIARPSWTKEIKPGLGCAPAEHKPEMLTPLPPNSSATSWLGCSTSFGVKSRLAWKNETATASYRCSQGNLKLLKGEQCLHSHLPTQEPDGKAILRTLLPRRTTLNPHELLPAF